MGTAVTLPDPTLVASRRATGRDGAVGAHLVIATPAPLDVVVGLLTEAHGEPVRSGPDRWVWRWVEPETQARRIAVATRPRGPLGVEHDPADVPEGTGTLIAVGRRVKPSAPAELVRRRERAWARPRRRAA